MFERLKQWLFRKDQYIMELDEEVERLRNEKTRLETKCHGLEELNRGLASDLAVWRKKANNGWYDKQTKKGGKK